MLRLSACLLFTCLLMPATNLHAASISVDSKVEDISYDMGAMHLQLQQLDSSMRLTPTLQGKLLVENLQAQRLVITIRDDSSPANATPAVAQGKPAGLPERFSLPLAISVRQAAVRQLLIITANRTYQIDDVALNLDANAEAINLELLRASTPWGQAHMQIAMTNRKPFAVNGSMQLIQDQAERPYDLRVLLSGNLEQLNFNSAGALVPHGKAYALVQPEHASVTADSAGYQLDGQIGIGNDMPLKLHAKVMRLRPALFGLQGSGELSLDADINGQLAPQAQLAIKLQSSNSTWQGNALTLLATMQLDGQRLHDIQATATLADNRLSASGALGALGDSLQWQAALPNLASLGREFGGSLQGSGLLQGTLQQLAASMQLTGQAIRLPGPLSVDQLQLSASMQPGDQGVLKADVSVNGIRQDQDMPYNVRLALSGTRQDHLLSVSADGDQLKLDTALQGKLQADGGWAGMLRQLQYRGNASAELEAPAALAYSSQAGLTVGKLTLRLQQGRIDLESLHHNGATLSTRGRLEQVGLRDMPGWIVALPPEIKGNPTFSGEWDLQLADAANGSVHLRRDSGDLQLQRPDNTSQALGLQAITFDVLIHDNAVTLDAGLQGSNMGSISAHADTRLSASPSGFALRADAPLKLDIRADMHSLGWLTLLPALNDANVDGKLNVSVQGDGTLQRPNLQGKVSGRDLGLVLPAEGLQLTAGILQAGFHGDRLHIDQLSMQGATGSISATGEVAMQPEGTSANLDWVIKQFTALNRTDRVLVLDGTLSTKLQQQALRVAGDVKVIRGLIELPRADTPVLGDDVVVIGREVADSSPLDFNIDGLRVDFGPKPPAVNTTSLSSTASYSSVVLDPQTQFIIRGRGLEAYLTGAMELSGNSNNLHGEGSIEARGTYLAYGQVLDIERGVINFSGPLDNPGLNLRAMRNNQTVRAGVEVTGNVQMPTVKLVSDPSVPDSDKLSWLVLGHGVDQAGKNEFAMLSLAASALFSQGESVPLQTRMARAAGLDSFSVSGSDAKSSSVNLGKRLSSRLYLSYEKSLTGLLNVARLTYDITKRWSVRTQAGSESAVDVLYTFSFK